jgi:uncharacterized protein with PIN domain
VTLFLCDEMLKGLARWLRAAGYDTLVAPDGTPDAALLAAAAREGRLLLTRDRRLPEAAEGRRLVRLLPDENLDATALWLRQWLGVDWLLAPFTRCLVDNAPLRAAGPVEAASLPPRARALPGRVTACPVCGRLYWEGSHVRRMRERLTHWREGAESAADRSVQQ